MNAPSKEAADSQFLTCLHEAGHAIVATAFGVPVSRVTVKDEARFYCYDETPIENMAMVAVVAFSGIEAERVVDPGASEKGASIDFSLAREVFAQYFHGQDEARFMERCRRQARALVRRFWIPIEWLTARLYLDDEVTGEAVRQILAEGLARKARDRQARRAAAFRRALANCGPGRGP